VDLDLAVLVPERDVLADAANGSITSPLVGSPSLIT
jgi:hypothetical protein